MSHNFSLTFDWPLNFNTMPRKFWKAFNLLKLCILAFSNHIKLCLFYIYKLCVFYRVLICNEL